MYGDTVIRVSTDNIGLARLPHGLDLIRVGKPLRPEFAAWRYGSRMRRRRLRGAGALAESMLTTGAAMAVGVVAAMVGVTATVTGSRSMRNGLLHSLEEAEARIPYNRVLARTHRVQSRAGPCPHAGRDAAAASVQSHGPSRNRCVAV